MPLSFRIANGTSGVFGKKQAKERAGEIYRQLQTLKDLQSRLGKSNAESLDEVTVDMQEELNNLLELCRPAVPTEAKAQLVAFGEGKSLADIAAEADTTRQAVSRRMLGTAQTLAEYAAMMGVDLPITRFVEDIQPRVPDFLEFIEKLEVMKGNCNK